MIYGVEQTTSREHAETKIVRFSTEGRARRWLVAGPGTAAWPGATDSRLPLTQQNHHHRHRLAYVMPSGWTLRREVHAEMKRRLAARSYRECTDDVSARLIWRDGTPLALATGAPKRAGEMAE